MSLRVSLYTSVSGTFTEKYGCAIRVISRWKPTSQTCCCCRFKDGKLDLSIREVGMSQLWD